MPADALRAVRRRIEQGWSQGADARDAGGDAVGLASRQAEAWSLLAAFALSATDGIPTDHVPAAMRALAEMTGAESFQEWNDHPLRTRQQVLDALDAAIARIADTP
jgi:hypothetical protein